MNNIFYRIVLAIYAFCLSIVSFLAVALSLGVISFGAIVNTIYYVLEDRVFNIVFFIVSVVFLLLSLIFLFSGVRSNRDKKYVGKYTNIGEVRISLNTLENIALAASRTLSGIRETKAFVSKVEKGVFILMKITVFTETNIPTLSEELQLRVKNAVEETSGVQVDGVRVMVENLTGSTRIRVE